jgi:hypothetical protein
MKSLDRKLDRLRAQPDGRSTFIICDAKVADAERGRGRLGPIGAVAPSDSVSCYRSRDDFLDCIRRIVARDLVDVMLVSSSVGLELTHRDGALAASAVTPAARVNSGAEIFALRGDPEMSRRPRSVRALSLERIGSAGGGGCAANRPDLGFYAFPYVEDAATLARALKDYNDFRAEAGLMAFRHVLEVCTPHWLEPIPPEGLAQFVRDKLTRALAAMPESARPLFTLIPSGAEVALAELRRFDRRLIVGVAGGPAGSTFDAFNLIERARAQGARAASLGRAIAAAEHQEAFLRVLAHVADGRLDAAAGVHTYHAVLAELGVQPARSLREDLRPGQAPAGGGRASDAVVAPERPWGAAAGAPGPQVDPDPDFDAMTLEEKLAYNQKRRDRIFG